MRLGERLMASGLIDEWQLMLGMRAARRENDYLGESLVRGRFITERELLSTLSDQLEVPFIQMDLVGASAYVSDESGEITLGDETVLEAMPGTVARRYGVFPLQITRSQVGYQLKIATADPNNPDLIDELSWLLQMEIVPVLASRRAISEAIYRFYGDDDDGESGRMPHPELLPDFRNFRQTQLAIA